MKKLMFIFAVVGMFTTTVLAQTPKGGVSFNPCNGDIITAFSMEQVGGLPSGDHLVAIRIIPASGKGVEVCKTAQLSYSILKSVPIADFPEKNKLYEINGVNIYAEKNKLSDNVYHFSLMGKVDIVSGGYALILHLSEEQYNLLSSINCLPPMVFTEGYTVEKIIALE